MFQYKKYPMQSS